MTKRLEPKSQVENWPIELSWRQERFCRHFLKLNGIGSAAAKAAGYKSRADIASARLLGKVSVRRRIQDLANRAGLTVGSCLATLKATLSAQKPIVVGKKVHFIDDSATQFRAAELGLKVHGVLNKEK